MSWWRRLPIESPIKGLSLKARDLSPLLAASLIYTFLYASRLDARAYLLLKAHKKELLHHLFSFVSFLGAGEVLLLFLFLFLALPIDIPGRREVFIKGLLGLIMAGLALFSIKVVLGRPRPSLLSSGHYWPHGPTLENSFFSTPSGHTTATTALAYIFSQYYPKTRYPLWTWVALVGISRVILFYHYPSDILVSVALGYTIGKGIFRAELAERWRDET